MDYETAVKSFYVPSGPGAPAPPVVTAARPARQLRDAYEPVATHPYWSRLVNERLAARGLNFLTAYVWGRASGLGEPAAGTVVATFAVFEPALITNLYEEGRDLIGRTELVEIRNVATTESLRRVLASASATDADIAEAVAILRRAVAACDPTGKPLFAGLASQPWPEDRVGQLWRVCDLLREHRGDSHVAACITTGLDPMAMNILTELWLGMAPLSYSATRGWPEDSLRATVERLRQEGLVADGTLSPDGQRLRDDLEAATDRAQQAAIDAIGSHLDKLLHRLNTWSAACITAGAFPPDIYKRAAG